MRRSAGWTLVELLVVVAIIGLLLAITIPGLSRARKQARRVVCASNQAEFGKALHMYADIYKRYPHQRQVEGDFILPNGKPLLMGGPLLKGMDIWGEPISAIGREFDEVVKIGLSRSIERRASAGLPNAAQVMACPGFIVVRDTYWYNGTPTSGVLGSASDTEYLYRLGYFWVGGTHFWRNATPAYSPISPRDPSDWALVADINLRYNAQSDWRFVAHRSPDGSPEGGNHLYNDGHVDWVTWNDGKNFRLNTDYSISGGNRSCFWRRRAGEP